jgi:hypothetical protein
MNTFSTTRLRTLMRREWMQHHRGWFAVMLAMPLLVAVLLPFGAVNVDGQATPPLLAGAVLLASAAVVCGLSWGVMLLQLPGLARRDQQDRSIEFWLSLPASHSESLAATLLMHVLALPLLALCVGAALGLPFGAAFVVKVFGTSGLAEVPWISMLAAGLAVVLRAALGLLLVSLWLAPLYLAAMAASAWLGRWGAPALVGLMLIGGGVLRKLYDNDIVFTLLRTQLSAALDASTLDPSALVRLAESPSGSFTAEVARLAGKDAMQSVMAALGSAQFLAGLLVAALAFALLVLQRRRSV